MDLFKKYFLRLKINYAHYYYYMRIIKNNGRLFRLTDKYPNILKLLDKGGIQHLFSLQRKYVIIIMDR